MTEGKLTVEEWVSFNSRRPRCPTRMSVGAVESVFVLSESGRSVESPGAFVAGIAGGLDIAAR
jgi:hypothetical protein